MICTIIMAGECTKTVLTKWWEWYYMYGWNKVYSISFWFRIFLLQFRWHFSFKCYEYLSIYAHWTFDYWIDSSKKNTLLPGGYKKYWLFWGVLSAFKFCECILLKYHSLTYFLLFHLQVFKRTDMNWQIRPFGLVLVISAIIPHIGKFPRLFHI